MNIVHTCIHIEGSIKDLRDFREAVKATYEVNNETREAPFAFHKITPIPVDKPFNTVEDEWLILNWGSLTEAINPEIEQITVNQIDLHFDTKAIFPTKLYRDMVKKFPSLKFHGVTWEEMGFFECRLCGDTVSDVMPSIETMRMIDVEEDEPLSDEPDSSWPLSPDCANDDITGYTFKMSAEEITAYYEWLDGESANDDVEDLFLDSGAIP